MTAATPQVRPVGDRAVLVEFEATAAVHRFAAAVRPRVGAELEDVVAGHRTVLLTWPRPPVDAALVERLLARADDDDRDAPPSRTVTIPVTYDGPDLARVAELTGLTEDAVVARHLASRYRVAFVGFAPGFGYLVGGDARLRVPRRDEPRERVPAGSVALAGEYAAVYPAASPGGWQLIGTTTTVLFDPARDPPALLEPGVDVRFTREQP